MAKGLPENIFDAYSTGSFNRSVNSHTPIKSRQICSLRLILAEKSSLVHDI